TNELSILTAALRRALQGVVGAEEELVSTRGAPRPAIHDTSRCTLGPLACHGVDAGELRVRGQAVVALDLVVECQLPVGGEGVALLVSDLRVTPGERAEPVVERSPDPAEVEGVIGERDEDQALTDLDRERHQPERRRVGAGCQPWRLAQTAVELVR